MQRREEFDEIRPFEESEMKQAFNDLLADRQFNVVMKGMAPWLPKALRNGLLKLAFIGVKTPLDFQRRFMKPLVKWVMRTRTDGTSFDDKALQAYAKDENRYTFVSNHRDIVLDSAFLDVMLFDAHYPTTVEIGIGDNLLIYPWIKRLVRMNKAFTVRRGLSPKEMLRSSQLMSNYIHYAVTEKRENIWIAQREGRAKDSDDRTQDAVLKMLAMGKATPAGAAAAGAAAVAPAAGAAAAAAAAPAVVPAGAAAASTINTAAASIFELNIVPLTISYEYDPCDYLKAQEFQ